MPGKLERFWMKHPEQNSIAHVLAGIGIGLLVYGFVAASAMWLGWTLIAIAIAWHVFGYTREK